MSRTIVCLALIFVCLIASTSAKAHKGKGKDSDSSGSGSGTEECTDCTKDFHDAQKDSPYLGPHRKATSEDCDNCDDNHYRHGDDANLRQWIAGDIDAVGDLTIDEDGTKHFASDASTSGSGSDSDDESLLAKTSKASRVAARFQAQAALEVAKRAKAQDDSSDGSDSSSDSSSDDGECESCTAKKIAADHAETGILSHDHTVTSTDCEGDCADGNNYSKDTDANHSLWTVGDIDKVGDLEIATDGTKTFLNPIDDADADADEE